ncbi:MAG: UV DNA damage repair endonuclease UvsE [Lentisphaerae bacterium]|nr:UV DNA damage repair endonuclease UvsE [Lentisphaerota bacterium]
MIRLGLCCIFAAQPIRFRTTTAASIGKLDRADALARLASLCAANAASLLRALQYCAAHGIGDFRVNSGILPLRTHPTTGYRISDLPGHRAIAATFRRCGDFAREKGIRLTFHPDQFVLLSSPNPAVTRSSVAELTSQAQVAEWIGADVINIHAGGAYGDKPSALRRVARTLAKLPDRVRSRLTLENDDRVYTPSDLIPFCGSEEIPFVYDVHHHRCRPDRLTVGQATDLAIRTWNREPLFHVSSPREGWNGPRPERHHDYIGLRDFPSEWLGMDITVEVEAKAKELAVLKLARHLKKLGAGVKSPLRS